MTHAGHHFHDGGPEKRRVARSSAIAAAFITLFKLVVGLQTNSLGILSEAAHSGLDLVAAVITLLAVSLADKPADEDHPYGHGKIENISAFVETLLLVLTCVWIIWEAIRRLTGEAPHVDASIWGYLVIISSIIVDVSRSRALARAAKRYGSLALEADALHFSSDIWTSLVVLSGLVFVSLGYLWVDAAAGIAVAILVLAVSFNLGKKTIDALMDRLPQTLHDTLNAAVLAVPGVVDVKSLRIRQSGAHLFVDTTIGIRRTVTFQEAHQIMDAVEETVRSHNRKADVIVHGEPTESADESVSDRVRMIVLQHGLRNPHNLEVAEHKKKLHITLDVECPPAVTFVDAHEAASTVEEIIFETISDAGMVTIHIEEHPRDESLKSDASSAPARMVSRIKARIAQDRRVLSCTDISLLESGDHLNLAFHCQMKRELSLNQVHEICTDVESRLRTTFPALHRITIHAEPR
jgi:cation diffusion facilitator family transporter